MRYEPVRRLRAGSCPAVLLVFTALLAALLSFLPAHPLAAAGQGVVRVVLDDTYPPYIFRDSTGALQGVLVDEWRLWEQKTGIRSELNAMEWAEAKRRMEAGEFDVIDTIFQTPQRQALFDFSPPYARLEVVAFYNREITGIKGIASLKGFPVAVKAGDAAIDTLKAAGIDTLIEYPSYEAIVKAAAAKKVSVFVIDRPPGLYFLHKYGIADGFRLTKPFTTGEFHRAVRKGDVDTLKQVVDGFAAISPDERKTIEDRWLEAPVLRERTVRQVLTVVAAALLFSLLLFVWNQVLRRQVRVRTISLEKEIRERLQAESALSESELKHRRLHESMTEAYAAVDLSGRIFDCNQAFQEMLGYSRDELQTISSKDLTPERWHGVEALIVREQVLARGASDAYEKEFRRRDGSIFPVELRTFILKDDQGTVTGMWAIVRDITERKRAETISQSRILFLEHAASHSLEEFLVTALDRMESLTRSETAFCHFVNEDQVTLSKQGWSTRTMERCDSTGDRGGHGSAKDSSPWLDCVEKKQAVIQNDYGSSTAPGGLPEGHIPVTRLLVVPVIRNNRVMAIFALGNKADRYSDDDARITSLLADMAWDIVERKNTEKAFHLVSYSLDKALEAVFWIDDEARICDVNETACRKLGYSREELTRLSVFDIDPAFPREQWPAHCQRIKEEHSFVIESVHRSKDGQLLPVEISVNHFDYGGRNWHCAMARDITERKQAEKEQQELESQLRQSQKMEAVGRLAGGVAHDFNNKLTVILGYAEMACRQGVTEERRSEFLQQITKAAEQSRDITRQLLAFSRQEAVSPKVTDLNLLVRDSRMGLARLIGEDIRFDIRTDDLVWPVLIDASQVDQIIMNLVVNARDAMPDGGTLEIATRNVRIDEGWSHHNPAAKPGDYVEVAVSDNGCGMDTDTLEHIFEPFYTTKEVGKGTGLGLAMVYGIMTQNNGFVNVSSEPGEGTTFRLYFPRVQGEVVAPGTLSDAGRQAVPATILLVEDDQGVLEVTAELLGSLGYHVLSAATPEEALDICKDGERQFDLVLVDVIMPVMTGKELAGEIVKLRPGSRFVFMSGYTSEVIARKGVLEEGIHFVQKPFDRHALQRKIQEALKA